MFVAYTRDPELGGTRETRGGGFFVASRFRCTCSEMIIKGVSRAMVFAIGYFVFRDLNIAVRSVISRGDITLTRNVMDHPRVYRENDFANALRPVDVLLRANSIYDSRDHVRVT